MVAAKRKRSLRPGKGGFILAIIGAVVLALLARPQSRPVLDLTAENPISERGFIGIPGSSGGGDSSGRSYGPARYQLPLAVQMLGVSSTASGEFVIELSLQNSGNFSFDLPVSRNLTEIQRPGNQNQRMFFFMMDALLPNGVKIEGVGGGTTGGSTTIIGSFQRLAPGGTLQVRLPVSATLLRAAFRNGVESVQIRVMCREWRLENARFFLQGRSDDLVSTNTVEFGLRGYQIVPVQP